jgi:hypothetical protein
MKCGPHSLQPTKGTLQNWITKKGEGYQLGLGIKLGLRPYCPTGGPYIQREAQPRAKPGTIASL